MKLRPKWSTVSVTGATGGLKSNTTSAVTSTEGGTGGTAVAFLVVVAPPAVAPPTIAKAFGAASIAVNGTTTLTFSLTNPNPTTALSGVGYTDALVARMFVQTGVPAADSHQDVADIERQTAALGEELAFVSRRH